MSFPVLDAPQRGLESSCSHEPTAGGQISAFLSLLLGPSTYKDKLRSRYRLPERTKLTRWRRKGKLSRWLICIAFLVSLWWFLRSDEGASLDVGYSSWGSEELYQWRETFDDEENESDHSGQNVDWAERRQRVKDAFIVSWEGYEQEAWGEDRYDPLNRGQTPSQNGKGWFILDALDTLMLMDLTAQVHDARKWIASSLRFDQADETSVFEATIRLLGGLLSAHYLSEKYPNMPSAVEEQSDGLYLKKAVGLADRLLGAFNSSSGIPYAGVNFRDSEAVLAEKVVASTAEAATIQLEFKYLAHLTGETEYWKKAERVMEVIESNSIEDGLVPIDLSPDTGKFIGEYIQMGSRGDSYYEYLIKQYLQTSGGEPIYRQMWNEALRGVRKHLVAYTKHASLTVIGERPHGLYGELIPKMDHLVCFLPGTIALGATGGIPLSQARSVPGWGRRQEEDMRFAEELMKTCWSMYLATETGVAAESTYFILDDPPRMMNSSSDESQQEQASLDDDSSSWRDDVRANAGNVQNLQRPETAESLFYLYRITGDETYREWGWQMFKSFVHHAAVIDYGYSIAGIVYQKPRIRGFTSLANVNTIPAPQLDNMESFWLSETMKYFYLLFSDRDFIPLEDTVFNTEAHIFPRFQMAGKFATGWRRRFPSTDRE